MMKRAAALTAVLLVFALGFASGKGGEKFTGHYTVGFETSKFVPCGKSEQWWIGNGSDALMKAAETARPGQTGDRTVYVELIGKVSAPGRYGHLGAYTRKIDVERVLTARAATEGDCK